MLCARAGAAASAAKSTHSTTAPMRGAPIPARIARTFHLCFADGLLGSVAAAERARARFGGGTSVRGTGATSLLREVVMHARQRRGIAASNARRRGAGAGKRSCSAGTHRRG